MRLTFVQYAGDYREAFERFDRGGKSTYQAQRYSVGFVGSLASRLEQVTVICAISDGAYDVTLSNKVRAIGAGLKPGFDARNLVQTVEEAAPDHLCLTSPMVPLLRWARRNRIRTLPVLADSFAQSGLLTAIRQRFLAHELNRPEIEVVANHGVNACLSLTNIGVAPEKIIPWDWPPSYRPTEHAPRKLERAKPPRLVYVGMVSEAKGVSDLLRALAKLKEDGFHAALTIIGPDTDGNMSELASRLGLDQLVHFTGVLANEDVPAAMRGSDIVIIPSRHEYPEGLPLTIYEALAARTPIIASDHPMFGCALVDGKSALTFRAADAEDLAAAIRRLSSDAELYEQISLNSEQAWQALQLHVTWGELIERWLSNTAEDRAWLSERNLRSGLYDKQIAARRTNVGRP